MSTLHAVSAATALLSSFVSNPAPWENPPANSDQRQPVYLGATPREMVLFGKKAPDLVISRSLLKTGESQAAWVAREAGLRDADFEAWPVEDEEGKLTWAFARWREAKSGALWRWLDEPGLEKLARRLPKSKLSPLPLLPEKMRTWVSWEASAVFDDFTKFPGLYYKPLFGSCVFTDLGGVLLYGGWYDPDQAAARRGELTSTYGTLCHAITQPPRFNDLPVSLVVSVRGGKMVALDGPEGVHLVKGKEGQEAAPERAPIPGPMRVHGWPKGFQADYRRDVEFYSGVAFARKNSAEKDNQLLDLVGTLEQRYAALGIRTRRQSFEWRGVPQANLIAVIPGSLPPSRNRPVLLADHIDTAFAEDVFNATGRRQSVPGADDNVSATAALLRAAEALKGVSLRHDIWLVHITGEEFPADDLGARHLVSQLLTDRQDIGGLMLMDMIAYRTKGDPIFQINAGDSGESVEAALTAFEVAGDLAPGLIPAVRKRFDERSYLYNTDGIIFSDAGYPVVLFNEHLNALENLSRRHYHETTDTTKFVDWEYATAIVKVAIETAARLADRP